MTNQMMLFRVLIVCLLCIVNTHGFVTSRLSSRRFVTFASTIGREIVSYPKLTDLAPIEISHTTKIMDIQDSDFFDRVIDTEGLSIVIFSSDWCGPCKSMETNLLELSLKHRLDASFYRIDTDTQPDTAADFNIRSIPSTLLFKNGRVVSEIVGAVPSAVVISQIEKHRTQSSPLI